MNKDFRRSPLSHLNMLKFVARTAGGPAERPRKLPWWEEAPEVSLLGSLPVLMDPSVLLPIPVTHLPTFSSEPEGVFEAKSSRSHQE